MKMLDCVKGGYSSSASVAGSTLVLSLPDASAPVVWRMDLDGVKAAAFEIRSGETSHVLVMKTPQGETQEIAPFDSKDKALKALMEASRAMEQAASAVRCGVANDSGAMPAGAAVARRKSKGPLITGVVGVVILLSLIIALTQAGPRMPQSVGGGSAPAAGSGNESGFDMGGDARGKAGVPVSADDFLKSR